MIRLVNIAVRKVVRLGAPVLRLEAKPLSHKEILSPEIQRLIEEMAASMDEYEGVGIAAPQVGESLSLFLIGLSPGSPRHPAGIETTVVFNPKARFIGSKKTTDWEGCLSAPGLRGQVERYLKLELSGLNQNAQAFKRIYEGFPARVVQHECDHLMGKVYLDRMKDLSSLSYASSN